MSKCILICAGDLLVSSIPVKEEDLVIACDAGLLYCQALGIEPGLILGDFDSLGEDTEDALAAYRDRAEIITLPVEKDDTDTLAALRIGLERGYREFHLYAATGGALDHTMSNIQCLLFLKDHGATGYIWEADTLITVIQNESVSFREGLTGRLSIFAMNGEARGVSIRGGLKYLVEDISLREVYPRGVSNSFTGQESTISVSDGTLLVMADWGRT